MTLYRVMIGRMHDIYIGDMVSLKSKNLFETGPIRDVPRYRVFFNIVKKGGGVKLMLNILPIS